MGQKREQEKEQTQKKTQKNALKTRHSPPPILLVTGQPETDLTGIDGDEKRI
jgi:hypothetical protein